MSTAICMFMILAAVEGLNCPPPIEEMPLSVASYWTMDEDGNYIAWNGQADDSPELAANGTYLTPDLAWQAGACISEWTTRYWTTSVVFQWGGEVREVACHDEFGRESYRRPFFHDGYGLWVIPVDVFSPEPVHGLVWEWNTGRVQVTGGMKDVACV